MLPPDSRCRSVAPAATAFEKMLILLPFLR
jgi:hypothetical protein